MSAENQQLRVIGGAWRGRKISFHNNKEIRPTPDRVRETLFNWLQADIHEARCLEPFAGSGILSIEALSRGALSSVLIDTTQETVAQICDQFRHLGINKDQYQVHCMNALDWLNQTQGDQFDILFLDPPFAHFDWQSLLETISTKNLLADDAKIYIESETAIEKEQLPLGWSIHRQKKAGTVHYCLCYVD